MQALTLVLLSLFTFSASAELMIFDVRKNLRMADSDPVYHDYYVNGGTELGMASGMVVTVIRHLPLYDSYQNHSAGDLLLKVARVKIIHTQKGLSVARLQSEFARENAPLLEDNFIMVGDVLDLSTASADNGAGAAGSRSADAGAAGAAAAAAERAATAAADRAEAAAATAPPAPPPQVPAPVAPAPKANPPPAAAPTPTTPAASAPNQAPPPAPAINPSAEQAPREPAPTESTPEPTTKSQQNKPVAQIFINAVAAE